MATKANTAKKTEPKAQADWSVIDTNVLNPKCTTKTRQHEVVDSDGTIHSYDLPGLVDKVTKLGCIMPPDHALKFLIDPAFKVFDADGKLIEPLKPQATTSGITLRRHETVATFQELTREALFNRVKRLPGGQLVPANLTNAKLIELLLTGGAPSTQRVEPGGEDLGAVDDAGEGDVVEGEIDLEGGDQLGGEMPSALAARKAEVMGRLHPAEDAGLG